jgi:hypothetical protein
MPIYTRDNINYGGMLGNAMANRANYLQHRYDRVAQMGQNWGNAINQAGQTVQNAFNQAAQYQYNKDQLANQQQFQAEQAALNRAQQLNMARDQQKFQAEQNALNRQNTYDIALMNKGVANQERQAQYVMNYQNAIAQQKYAEDMLFNARPGSIEYLQAQKALQESKNKADYYKDMIPHQLWEVEAAPQPITGDAAEAALKQFGTPAPLPKWQQDDLLAEWKALDERSGGKYDDATAKRMNEIADQLNNESLRVQIATKGATAEQRQAASAQELADAQAQFAANGTYDSKKFKIKYSKGKASLVRK